MADDYDFCVQSGSARHDPWGAYTYDFYENDEQSAVKKCRELSSRRKDCVVVRWTITQTELADPTVVFDPKKVKQ
ncbi:MAG: hypothetical protein ACYTFW_00250 [Planctomycetota bacterium]|jgi:hypothetical protein